MAALTNRLERCWSLGWLVIAALTVSLLAGCFDLFRPDKPVPPSDHSGSVTVDLSVPTMALATMASAIAAKGQRDGQTAYISAFANPSTDVSGFTTQFDADVARAFVSQGGVVPTWTYNLERDFYSSFLRVSSDGYLMRWEVYQGHGGDDGDPEAGDSTLHRRYRVFTLDADNNIGPLIALGIADLAFKRIAPSRWVIVQWDDQVDRTGGDAGANAALSFSKRRLESLSQ